MQGAPPLRVELYSRFSFLVWLFICTCVFLKLITCGICSPVPCQGHRIVLMEHFPSGLYISRALGDSGHSSVLALGRPYPPCSWGKPQPPGAQSLAIRSGCSRRRSARVTPATPPLLLLIPGWCCHLSLHFCEFLSLSSLLFVASPEGFSPSVSPPVSSKPKASSPLTFRYHHRITTAENTWGSGPFSAPQFSSCALHPGQGTTGSSGVDGARVQGRTLRDALHPSGLLEWKIVLHFLK